MIVRRIKNMSGFDVPIELDERTTVVMKHGEEYKNLNVDNLEKIKSFVSVEYDLSEVPILENKRKILFD